MDCPLEEAMKKNRPEPPPYGVLAPREKDGCLASIPWDKARAFQISCCRIRPNRAITLVLIALLILAGCYPIPIPYQQFTEGILP